jgi:hypothetical protein
MAPSRDESLSHPREPSERARSDGVAHTRADEWWDKLLPEFDRKCRGEASLSAEVVHNVESAKQLAERTEVVRMYAVELTLFLVHAVALLGTVVSLCGGAWHVIFGGLLFCVVIMI